MTKIAIIVGSRPEAIKLAPVIRALRARTMFDVRVVSTGQQEHLISRALADFGIVADDELVTMAPGQSLGMLTSRLAAVIDGLFAQSPPDVVVVQGDTTSAMVGALSGFYSRALVAHVEAGLRTRNRYSPFPEEINRRIISQCAGLHFAPTETARDHLLAERVSPERVVVTGNTVIDALFWMREITLVQEPSSFQELGEALSNGQLILATMHRRENIGQGIQSVCEALRDMLDAYPKTRLVLPVHPNPGVQRTVRDVLEDHPRSFLTDPLDYPSLVHVLSKSHMVVTDSGGLQEEAPALGIPVVVIRETTERPEIVEAGGAWLVGTTRATLFDACSKLLHDRATYAEMAVPRFPYGNGTAAVTIAQTIEDWQLNREVTTHERRPVSATPPDDEVSW